MISQVFQDCEHRPELFRWFGPIAIDDLRSWCRARELSLPEDLVLLLSRTGGGDLFESETILGPHFGYETGDDWDSANRFHHERGLPRDFHLFHVGFVLSAVKDGGYTVLSSDYAPGTTYRSLEEWYLRCIRAEFQDRYGLNRPE